MHTAARSISCSILTAALLLVAGSGIATTRNNQEPPAAEQDRGGFNPDILVRGLQSMPGCLGTELAQFQSGKIAIFAWFESREAAVRWYYHPAHRGAMRAFFPEDDLENPDVKPMAHIADDAGPLLVIATLTPRRGARAGEPPITQISIEHYQPMPGGVAVSGRLAPDGVKVPHLREFATFGSQ